MNNVVCQPAIFVLGVPIELIILLPFCDIKCCILLSWWIRHGTVLTEMHTLMQTYVGGFSNTEAKLESQHNHVTQTNLYETSIVLVTVVLVTHSLDLVNLNKR